MPQPCLCPSCPPQSLLHDFPLSLLSSFAMDCSSSPRAQSQALSGHTEALLSPSAFYPLWAFLAAHPRFRAVSHMEGPHQDFSVPKWPEPARDNSSGLCPSCVGCTRTAKQQRRQLKAQQGSDPEVQQLPAVTVPGIASHRAAESGTEPLLPLGN